METKIKQALIHSGLVYIDDNGNYRTGIEGDTVVNASVQDIVEDLTE